MSSTDTMWRQWYKDYGVLLVLLALCVFFSLTTWAEQDPRGSVGGRQAARKYLRQAASDRPARPGVVVVGSTEEERVFARAAEEELRQHARQVLTTIHGDPGTVRVQLLQWVQQGYPIGWIICSPTVARWPLWEHVERIHPQLADALIVWPDRYWWPNFLKKDNLFNVTNQITVIAVLAAGMTLVIITGGIDLSVGSLVALSAVLTTRWIRDWGGAESASTAAMVVAALAAVLVCGAIGTCTGFLVTLFRKPPQIPPFIVTLAVMLAASGAAYMACQGQSINQVPDSFVWLGRGADLLGIPNAVVVMGLIYIIIHGTMKRTVFGRYVYAVGGNQEAARLSGVPVRQVLIAVYTLCAALAGLGGVMLASQLKSGAPTYGQMYELYVIAAVVVGGTSLAGGQGSVLGTMFGAFVIAVIQNGMNLMGLESYTQKIVLGSIILIAVVLDRMTRIRVA